MIAKIKTGSFVSGMVAYNAGRILKKNSQGDPEAKYLGSNLIFEGSDPNNVTKQITLRNDLANGRYGQTNLHISLNFHQDDIIDDVSMRDIADQYMENMGYAQVPYAVYRHLDKAHPHLHIVASQIDEKGKKINDSNIHYRSMGISREMEKTHNLTSPKRKTEKRLIDQASALNNYAKAKVSLSETLYSLINDALVEQPTNESEFTNLLRDRGVVILKNQNPGIKGYGYTIDQEQEKYAPVISGSQIDSLLSFDALQNEFSSNLGLKNRFKKQVQGKVRSILTKSEEPILLSNFVLMLQKKGLALTVKRRQTGGNIGKINGYLYKDLKTGITYNSSELNFRLNQYDQKIIDDKIHDKSIDISVSEKKDEKKVDAKSIDQNYTPEYISNLTNLLDILGPTAGQAQEIDSAKESKRKKKRRKKK